MRSALSRRATSLIVLIVVLAGAALAYASDGYTASQGTPVSITGPDGVCKKVTNNSGTGLSEYIPMASTAEWQSFYTNPPAGVTIAACAPACSGVSVGGFCWYAATSVSQSCTTVCSAHGGYNSGTLSYAGSGGSNANCLAVVAALFPGATNVTDGLSSSAAGCLHYIFAGTTHAAIRFHQPSTTAGATGGGVDMRVCACNN